jgi:hypothetical protein
VKYLLALFLPFYCAVASTPQYYVTAANHPYYESLLNLIGSIHHTNFEELEQILVVDMGLKSEQVEFLETIQKVTVIPLEKTHPNITDYFDIPGHCPVFGWYAWKPVAITQALRIFPYVLWMDAGSVALKKMTSLFEYIKKNKYFLCTIGDDQWDGRGNPVHSVGWGATSRVKELYGLNTLENRWILDKESVMGGLIGVAAEGQSFFLSDLYEFSKTLIYYADDGTASALGNGRHDQTLLSSLAYMKNLTVHKQDGVHGKPFSLDLGDEKALFNITYREKFIDQTTNVYSCRTSKYMFEHHMMNIRFKENAFKKKGA